MLNEGVITVRLEGARFYAFHGVFEQEAAVGAEFEVDVAVRMHPTDGMLADCLEGTVSYADIYDEVKSVIATRRLLIERVALEIGSRLRQRWPQLTGGTVKVKKKAPPIAGFTGCTSVCYEF